MSEDKPWIISDVDGVLLEWVANLPHFLNDIGRDPSKALELIGTNNWASPEELFGTETKEEAHELMNQYGDSLLMACLPAYDATVIQSINRLKEHFHFAAVTAIGTGQRVYDHRAMNLQALFPNAFHILECTPHGADKSEAIAKVVQNVGSENIFCYVDDWDKHIDEAESVGVTGYRYGRLNRGRKTNGHRFVQDWHHLELLAMDWLEHRGVKAPDPVVEYWAEKEL